MVGKAHVDALSLVPDPAGGAGDAAEGGIPIEARTLPGFDSMFKSVRIWPNLIQIIDFVKANSEDIPKTMRIFVH